MGNLLTITTVYSSIIKLIFRIISENMRGKLKNKRTTFKTMIKISRQSMSDNGNV